MNLIKRISIILLCIILFSFCFSGSVHAADGIGGKLLKPVVKLVLALADGLYDILHAVLYGQEISLIRIDLTSDVLDWVKTILVGIAAAAAMAALVIIAATGIGAIVEAIAGITLTAVSAGTVVTLSLGAAVIAARGL